MAAQTPSLDIHLLRTSAEAAARRAGAILAERFHQERTIEFKGGIDLVTDSDKASEAALLAFIRDRFPDHAVLAEESGAHAGTPSGAVVRWVIDPLDGTTNYAHRVPHFCVSVGVEQEGTLLAGAVFDPIRGELFSAGRGQGATVNGLPLKVSTTTSLGRSLLCTGFPYDVRENPAGPLGLFSRFIRRAQGIRRMGSAALDLAYVAAGRFDGFFEFGLQPWDIAAGALLIQEAGGEVTNIDGSTLTLTPGNIVCGAPGIMGELGSECRAFLAELGPLSP